MRFNSSVVEFLKTKGLAKLNVARAYYSIDKRINNLEENCMKKLFT
tara:strand:+ start:354 stop:491 length:138 start_codon:yes stop_codon:yes gene_type:complete